MASLKGLTLCSDKLFRLLSNNSSSAKTILFSHACCFNRNEVLRRGFASGFVVCQKVNPSSEESKLTHAKSDGGAIQTSFAKKGISLILITMMPQYSDCAVITLYCHRLSAVSIECTKNRKSVCQNPHKDEKVSRKKTEKGMLIIEKVS
jgi:hypothetical protein